MPVTIVPEGGTMLVNRVSRLLGERRLSISEASRESGVSYKTVFDLYHDRTTRIDLATIDRLCKALACTPNDLFEYVSAPTPQQSES